MVERETQLAKELAAAGERQKALLCLRRKRYQEDMLKKTDQQLTNLEQLVRGPHIPARCVPTPPR